MTYQEKGEPMSEAKSNQNGKGSVPRPMPNRPRFEKNWEKIFKKGKKK